MSDHNNNGFGLDQKRERQIETNLVELIQLVGSEPGNRRVVDLARETRELTRRVRSASGVDEADLATGEPHLEETPTVVYGGIPLGYVHERWIEQQAMNAKDALSIFKDDRADVVRQRVRSGVRGPAARPTALLEALGEIEKVGRLLSASTEEIAIEASDTLLEEGDSADVANWQPYGDFDLTQERSGFRFRNTEREWHDAMTWTTRCFSGNHIWRSRFTPHTGPGGVIFAICGLPRTGKDLSDSAKETMEPYNTGIDAYHVSVYREGTRMTNLRRPGRGLKMLATQSPDPCEKAERSYDIQMVKYGTTLMFLVDGNLIHHYVDAGVYGPSLTEGHVGIRHWRNTDASYRNIGVHSLVPEAEPL